MVDGESSHAFSEPIVLAHKTTVLISRVVGRDERLSA
jgi:hypothetical protein